MCGLADESVCVCVYTCVEVRVNEAQQTDRTAPRQLLPPQLSAQQRLSPWHPLSSSGRGGVTAGEGEQTAPLLLQKRPQPPSGRQPPAGMLPRLCMSLIMMPRPHSCRAVMFLVFLCCLSWGGFVYLSRA